MSGRFKSYVLIILGALIVALLLGPPLAFATKLPKACNIFQENKINKSGPCGHQVTLSKVKCHEGGVGFVSTIDFGICNSLMVPISHPALSVPSENILNTAPLRC